MGYLKLVNGVMRMVPIYQETYVVSGTLAASTPIALPATQTYDSTELDVYLDGILVEVGVDYNYVGTAPRTQVSFIYDLTNNERVNFVIDRSI